MRVWRWWCRGGETLALNTSIFLVPRRLLRGANLISPLKTQRHASLNLNLTPESPASSSFPSDSYFRVFIFLTHQSDILEPDTLGKSFEWVNVCQGCPEGIVVILSLSRLFLFISTLISKGRSAVWSVESAVNSNGL